eukprot:11333927-Heterocapsa_arctica.AAC.1
MLLYASLCLLLKFGRAPTPRPISWHANSWRSTQGARHADVSFAADETANALGKSSSSKEFDRA